VLLDVNDARPSPFQYRSIRAKVGGTIHLLALQAAGASWYPMCYASYTPEQRQELARRKRRAKLAYVHRAARIVDPIAVVPFAGPPCFLDPELFQHNSEMDDGIFPDQQQAVDWLRGRGLTNAHVLLPGDAWDIDVAAKDADPAWAGFSLTDRWPYLRAYADRRRSELATVLARYPQPEASLWESFRSYFERLLTMSPYFNQKIGMRVGFEITGPGGGEWAVDFRPESAGVFDTRGECAYGYRIASRWLPPILSGAVPWEDFFLSLRFQAWRQPDVYNDHLLGLLKFAHEPALQAVERFETTLVSEERITVHAEGRTYRIQRLCPHAGNDLLDTGEVLPGRIIACLAHHYEFSLDTGECLTGTCPPLRTERIG
jgi:UDP-MurNAc hydroxylase